MDKITIVKTKLRKENCRELIEERPNSGLKVKDWCKKNNITKDSYYYWLRKDREDTI